jgi:hypothetical protein
MKDEMKNGKTSMVSKIFCKENLRVTCVERKYKVSNSKIGFIVTAKKELDENTTNELLREDMELKTFLANYEITDVVPVSECQERVSVIEKNVQTRETSIANIMTKKNGVPARNDDIRVKNGYTRVKNDNMSAKGNDKLVGNHSASKNVKNDAINRRELFDSLDLSETFVIKDYKKALEKKGIITTNTAMPYDDLEWLEKQGKVTRIGKGERGAVSFMIKKKENETVTQ